MLYSIVFLRARYSLRLSGGMSLSLYMYCISLALGGVIGLFVSWQHDLGTTCFVISLAFAFSPLLLFFSPYLRHIPRLARFSEQLTVLTRSKRLVMRLTALNVVHTVALAGWFYYIGVALGVDISVSAALLLAALLKASIIFKLTPGNLGLEQMLAGGVAMALGYETSDGMLISLGALATSLLITVPVGFVCSLQLARTTSLAGMFCLTGESAEEAA
jgi:hypothetical protein